MLQGRVSKKSRMGNRVLRIAVCALLVLQTLWIPNNTLAASAFYFRGYDYENVTSYTFAYATSGATVSGTTVTMQSSASEGMAVGLVNLNEDGYDISQSIDLGGLEIDFSTLATVTQEGTDGIYNDIPTVDISFCSTSDNGSEISSVHLAKPDNAVSGGVTLSSGAHIPAGTRSIFVYLTGTNTTIEGNPEISNTVVFSNTSLVIHDAATPSCSVDYNKDWVNTDITVTIEAADSDAGLEGIYLNDERVSQTSPYIFVVSSSDTSFTAYAKDLADKQSEVISETVDNIDKTVPSAPSSVPLSSSTWSNTDVYVLMPALGVSSGAPERYVYQTGTSAWADLPDGYAISANGYTTIRVAVEDAAGNRSSYAEATANIDMLAPVIGSPTTTIGSGSTRVDITATEQGLSGLKKFAYAAGEQTADYFTTGGIDITENTFTVETGGTYTVYASDNAGNTALKTLSLTTAPTMEAVADITINEDETRNVPLTVSDAETALSDLIVRVTTTDDALLETVTVNQSESAVSLDITPAANQFGGPVTVTVEVEDADGLTVSRSFAVTVDPVNDPPDALDDTDITLNEDTTITIDVLANDSDAADNDTLSISETGAPMHGTTLIVLGKIRYTPSANYAGTDNFIYTISDGNGGSAQASVYVTVTNVNDAPAAKDDTATAREDIAATIDVLSNDTDVDTAVDAEETISLLSCTNGGHGTTEIVDGMIVYTPEANFNGTDTFTYTIQDRLGLLDEATVTVNVAPESDDPIFNALADEYTIDEDEKNHEIAFEISDVETPEDSLMLQAASLNTDLLEQTGIAITGLGDSSAEVKLLLSPVADQFGDVEIRLTLGDGFNTVERTILVHVLNVNDAPRVTADKITYVEDAESVDIEIASLLSNDSDIEGDTIFFDGLETLTTIGSIEQLNDTTLRYTPKKDYEGLDSFTYYVSDGAARTLATCTLEATGVNDAPTIAVDGATFTTNEDALIVIPFEIADNESSAASLSVIAATSDDNIVTTDGITIVNNGDGTGEVQIQPADDANGTVTLTLTVSDGEAQSSDSFSLVINPMQDAPVAVNDKVYVLYSGSRVFSVLENDHDVDGDTLTVDSYVEDLTGTLTFNEETQQFTYYPAIGENGIGTFTYTITDGTVTATATVTLNVTTVTHAPVITSIDNQYTNEDNSISGIAFSVSDEDIGDTAEITVTSSNTALVPNKPENIIVSSLGGGEYSLSLVPLADQSGASTITVTVTDSTDLTDSTSFTLIVIGQNDAPVAVDDSFTINEDSSLVLSLLTNDSDPDGDTIWLSSLSSPAHGYIESNGYTYTYHPYGDWNGTDTLTYRISDGRATAQASVIITVNPVNDRPVAWDDWRELPQNTAGESANINVLANDYDVDSGDVIHTYQIVTAPRNGTAVIEDNGTITYTRTSASAESNGADSFVYRIIDRDTATGDYSYDDATVYIGIEFISSLYTYGRSVTCNEDAPAFDFDLYISNPNGVDYTLTIDTTTTLGTFTVLDNNTARFTPAPDQNGYASITYTVEQVGGGEKDTGTIWLRVYPVNDLPIIDSAPASVTMDEDTSGGSTFDVTFHDPDCAAQYLYFYVYTRSATTTAPIPFQTSYAVSREGGLATVTITAADNVNGTGEIVVGVSDGMSCDEAVIDLTITPVDDAPVVNDVERTIYEDSSVTFASPGSGSEVDGDTTVESILPEDAPAHGTVTINTNKTIQYVPDANYFGTEIFYVTITDQTEAALSNRAVVTITVTPINDQPEIFDLEYYQSTLEDTAKDVTLTVIDVDNDLSGSESYTLTSSDQTLVKDENITISNVSGNQMKIHVVPEENANGTLVVNIVASDGSLTAEAAFELKIIPVNDIPVAVNDTKSVDEVVSTGAESTPPKTTTTLNLLTNDSDVEDGKPKVVSISDVVNGTVTNLGSGNVSVSADGDFNGDVTFTYTVMDRAGSTASAAVTVTVNPVNDPPRAKNDSITIDEDAQPSISVLTNDTDPEGDTLSITAVSNPGHGTAEINGTKVDYIPTADYYGSDSFTYTISDGNDGTASATVYITIKPVNDAPTIAKHISNLEDWTMSEDTTASFNFVVADAESAASGLIIKITSQDETIIKTTQIALTTNAAGYKTITVTPEPNANGVVPVKFWVSDGLLSTEATYTITIASVNDAPVVTAEKQQIKEDNILVALASATDVDGDEVSFYNSTDPSHGYVAVEADGSYTYTPDADYNGEDSFIIAADDGNMTNNVGYATVNITILPDNDPPVAGDDSIEIDEDVATLIPVLDNDSDPDADYGDEIVIYHISTPAHGTAVLSEGAILYTPAADYNGTDTFTYTITDNDGKMDTASVSIVIDPVNDAPRGGDDTATVLEDHSVTIDAAANDDIDETTNPDLEDVTIKEVDDPAHGTAVIDAGSKTITYTPDANWFSPTDEPEVFYYTAQDSSNQTARFAITVTVTSVNDLPVITPDTLPNVTTNEDTATSAITFTVSDVETAAGLLNLSVTHNNSTLLPAVTVTPSESGECSFTVTPNANKVGTAAFTVTVTDKNGGQDTANFTLTVTAVNDLPVAEDDAFSVEENSSRLYNVLQNDDVDIQTGNGGDTLTLLPDITPQYGTAVIENNQLRYTPNANRSDTANYTDVFTYTMKDASNNESTATVTVTVTPVNDAPTMTAIADVTGILEDAPDGTGDISFSVTDEEDDDDTLAITITSSNTTLFPLSNITITNPTDDPSGSLRTVKAIPAANEFGTGSITLTVRDLQGLTYSRTFSVTVDSVNDIPNNGDKSFTVEEDVEKQLYVLTDIDPDYETTPGDFTVIAIASQPSHGTVRIAADGKSVYYKTAQDSNEPDSFEYTIRDAYGNANYTFTASITVTPVNDAPVITYKGNASYEIYEGTALNDIPFTVTDVDNVTYAGGEDAVEVTLSAKSSNSILLKNGINIDTLTGNDRNIDLQPYLKWNGTTTVTITAADPDGLKATASFTLIVDNVNDTPVAVNDTGVIQEDTTTAVYVLVNDLDDDLLTNPDTEFIKINTVTDNDPNATIVAASNGLSVLVTPNLNYNGPVSFSYTIVDSANAESNTATVTLTVAQVNDAPETDDDSETTTEDKAVDIYVLSNDRDIDTDEALNAHPEYESIGVVITGALLTAPSHGTIKTDGTKITYTPGKDYNGEDTFDYYCSDGDVQTMGTVTVTITQVNDSPIAVEDSITIDEDTTTGEVDVLANDTDVDTGSALNQDVLHLRSTFEITTAAVTDEAHGSVTISNNKLVFTPALNWFGEEVIHYTMSDGNGGSSSSTLTVTVSPVNDLPLFDTAPENLSLSEDGADGTTTVVVSDVETAAASLSVTVTDSTNPTLIATSDVTVTAGTGGMRTITVNPKDNQNGSAEITLKVDDLTQGTRTIKFTVTVAAVNDDPVSADKTLNINEDAPLQTITKSSVASDVDIATNADVITLSITTAAQHGTASIDANGNITYKPNANFNGTDTFVYTATDTFESTDTGTVTVNIAQVNDAPETDDDSETTTEDKAVDIYVLSNDRDIDTDEALNAHPEYESIGVVITGALLTAPSHGTIKTDGTKITYTPGKDYNGEDTFDYYCSDGDVQTMGTVTVTITQVNDSPIAVEDSITIDEDTTTGEVDVLANDTDVDTGSALNQDVLHLRSTFEITTAAVTDEAHGSVTISNNKLVFTPALNWFGEEVIHYTMSDGNGGSSSSTLTVTVSPVNDLPLFDTAPENLSLSEDGADGTTTVVVSDVETAAASLSVTVTDSTNPTLIATSDVTVTAGTGGMRTITVNPKDNQNGSAEITLKVDDLTQGTRTIKFTVTVAAVNDDPVSADKTLNINEDAPLQTITKSSVASDVDIATNADVITLSITTAAQHGTASIDANGNITYKPNANFNGTDTFVYTATDTFESTDTGTVTVNIAQVNDAPETDDDSETTTEDKAVDIYVLSNDRDIDTDEALNAHPEYESIGVVITGALLTAPSHGTIKTDGTKITYTPGKDYNGEDTFDYYCSDGDVQTMGTVTVTITQVNDSPIAVEDSGSTDEDTPIRVNVLENDTDVDTNPSLNEDVLHDAADFAIDSCYIYGTAHGTVTKNGASIDYDPEANFYGTQIIKYVLSDGHGGTSIGTLTIEVGSENDAPVAVDDAVTGPEDAAVSVNVLTNDTDVDTDDTKTFVGFTETTSGLPGTFVTNEDGDITFTPNANYNGSFSIDYQMRDAGGLTSIATLTITITLVNDAPTAQNADRTAEEDTPKGFDVDSLIADVDIQTNGDALTVSVASTGETPHGTVSVSGTTITYTPDENYNGSDEIAYTVTDKAGAQASAKLYITVNAVNDAPLAVNDTKTTTEDTTAEIFALANDSDIDTDAALNAAPAAAPTIASVTNGAHGTAETDGTKITYTPNENYNGTDVITYVLTDGELTNEATVSITITQVNDSIQAINDMAETNDEDTVTIDVLANDTDVDTDSVLNENVLHLRSDFSITAVGTPSHGTAQIVSGKVEYTPEDRFAGTDSFSCTVSDGHGSTATALVTVTVHSVNDAPKIIVVGKPEAGDIVGTGSKVIVEWTGFDIDGDVLTYKLEYYDGASWHLAADNLSESTYTFGIPDLLGSTDGLKFRVSARDSEFTSNYGYSAIITVDKDAPTGTIVTMRTADGRTYTAGTWTNQTVSVVASSATDASKVTYYYAMDGGTSAAGTGMDVVAGVHTVDITAMDEFSNTQKVGSYLARVDKQQPAEPEVSESSSGASIVLSFTFATDPGGSGNNKITLPDGTSVNAADHPTYAVTKNGTYSFSLTDVAGNRRAFTYTVSSVDITKPVITLDSGDYRVGVKTQSSIHAVLTFTDAESEIVARGYQISTSSTASGTYRTYSAALTLSDPGTYYIHATAKNAFGLATYQTFGPFMIEAATTPTISVTPSPETGDVVLSKGDIEEITEDAEYIRLPGGEWGDTLTLENVEPGSYLVEVMDKDGNIRTVEVRVTKRDIFARSVRSAADTITTAGTATIAAASAALLLLIFLLASYNVTFGVRKTAGGAEKKLRTLRRVKLPKKVLVIQLENRQIAGGEYVILRLAKVLSKNMRGKTVVVTINGGEVLREMVPEDTKEAFVRLINLNQ